jgi:predicted dehydrogenase
VLLPALRGIPGVERVGLVTATGVSARSAGERFGFSYCATELDVLLADPRVHAVIIATRHSQHAAMTAAALRAGKAVLVEKPLALSRAQLEHIEAARAESGGRYLVGFSRRFAPLAARARDWFADRSAPLSMLVRVNAGELPAESWLREVEEGGGRRIGEVCHFLDLLSYLAGAPITQLFAEGIGAEDVSIVARLGDGSVGTVQYVTGGTPALGKEWIEVHGGARSFRIEDWRIGRASAAGRGKVWKSRGAQKGHAEELAAFLAAVRDGAPMPVPEAQGVQATLATLALVEALRSGVPATPAMLGAGCWVLNGEAARPPAPSTRPAGPTAPSTPTEGRHTWSR